MNGKDNIPRTIGKESAIELARNRVVGLNYVDPNSVTQAILLTQADVDALAIAMAPLKMPKSRDRWLISFARVNTGSPLDGLHDSLMVVVDAESGTAEIRETF